MKPVRHAGCNKVYKGPTPNIGDLHCIEQPDGHIDVVYEFDDADREMIANGGKVMLGIYSQPIPPVSMQVMPKGFCEPIGEHGFKAIPELEDEERQS